MAVTDRGTGLTPGVGSSGGRFARRTTSLGVASAALVIVNVVALTLAHQLGSIRFAIADVVFYFTTTELVVFILILLTGGILANIPTARPVGFGILLAFGGLITLEWTGLSNHFYPARYDYGSSALDSTQILAALAFLGFALALSVISAIGIVAESPAPPNGHVPDRARPFFILAAVASFAWVLLYDLYPNQYAFRSFAPLGIVLDLLGIAFGAGAFVLLGAIAVRRAAGFGVTFAWAFTAGFIFVDSSTGNFSWSSFTDFNYRWKYDLALLMVIAVAVSGAIGSARRPGSAPRNSPSSGSTEARCASGHPMPPLASFCPNCGSPRAVPVAPGPIGQVCPNGHAIPVGDVFCSDCGMAGAEPSGSGGQVWPRKQVDPLAAGNVQHAGYLLSGVPTTNGFAIGALISGILGLSVLAIAFGFIARSQIRQAAGSQKGDGMAMAGIVLGIAWVVISIIFTVAILAIVAHQNSVA